MIQPLADIKVLDFSTLLPGPMATLMLAEAGAKVTKIEPARRGEEMRTYQPRWGAYSINFSLLNRGKTCLGLDLKSPRGHEAALALAADADVLVEQFRPGVMERLGLDYQAVRALNPGIVYCSITGYGQTGPKRELAGHDLNYIGDTGLLALSAGDAWHRVVPPALIADIAGGAYPAVMNILLALRRRNLNGEGCRLDVAMAENVFPLMYWALGSGQATGAWPGNGTDLVTGSTARYRLYDTADGKIVAAAAIESKFWAAFTEAIELEEPLRDDRRDPTATRRRIEEIIASRTAAEWEPRLVAANCCCTIVKSLREALDDPHFIERGVFDHGVTNEQGQRLPSLPVAIDKVFRAPPGDVVAPSLQDGGG